MEIMEKEAIIRIKKEKAERLKQHFLNNKKTLEIYKRLAEFTKDGVFSYSFDRGEILFANQSFVDILGLDCTPFELIGKKMEEVIQYSQDPGLVRKKISQEGKIHNFEYKFKTLSGKEKIVLHNSFLREDSGKKIVEATVRDITLRREMEKKILFSQFVLEHMSNPVLWVSAEGKINYANEAAVLILEYSKTELIGSKIFDIDDNFFEQNWPEYWEKTKKKKVFVIRSIYKAKSGKVFPVEITANYMDYDREEYLCIVVKNLTEHQRVENALRRAEQEKTLILDSLSELVFYYDSELKTLWVNKAAGETAGEPPSNLIGVSWEDIWKKLKVSKENHPVSEFIKTGEFQKKEVVSEDKKFWLVRIYPIKNIENQTVGIVEIALDITQRKNAEGQRKISLARTRRILEETVEALAATSERRDPYTAGHQRRVAQLACAIAREMGLAYEQVEGIRMAANIHDVGKVYVPAEILSKPTTLSGLEFSIIQTHPQIGYDILKEIEFPWPIASIVLQHHEKLDGSGYPNGLKGKDILIEAKILTVSDIVEAMASHRPYRAALGIEAALEEIKEEKKGIYDREIVSVCLNLFSVKRFRFK